MVKNGLYEQKKYQENLSTNTLLHQNSNFSYEISRLTKLLIHPLSSIINEIGIMVIVAGCILFKLDF